MSYKSVRRALALLFAFTLVAAACGSSDEETIADANQSAGTDETGEGGVMEDGLSGEIVVSGSSTVEPISVAVAESYKAKQPDVNISVSGPGTGDGFKQFCAGETDVSDASRTIKDEEAEDCAANGIEYVELKVAVDGIAVMTSDANTAVECLSFADLYALVGPESTGFAKWSDADDLATTVGGNGGFPDADLVISAPGTESGTYDSFVEIVLEDTAEAQGQEDPSPRPDYSSAADDNVIIATITGNDTSFGWVGFAFADQTAGVKMIQISEETGGDCVAPTAETIASNEYPIARDLWIYVNKAKAAESEALVDFIDHYVSFGLDDAAAEVDYVELTEDSKTATRDAWSGR